MSNTLHPEERKLLQLDFFHPEVNNHTAQALLLQQHIGEGTFLLRFKSNKKDYAVSVKAGVKDVKHYEMCWTGTQFEFGHGTYDTVEELQHHFMNKPLIAGESGLSTVLVHPYPCRVEEYASYDIVAITAETAASETDLEQPNFSINNKAGYLTKLGGVIKSWRTRWFVLESNELKYFKDSTPKLQPIRVLDLNECLECEMDDTFKKKKKQNVFRLKFSWRTFYMYASSAEEVQEWVNVIKWRLNHGAPQAS